MRVQKNNIHNDSIGSSSSKNNNNESFYQSAVKLVKQGQGDKAYRLMEGTMVMNSLVSQSPKALAHIEEAAKAKEKGNYGQAIKSLQVAARSAFEKAREGGSKDPYQMSELANAFDNGNLAQGLMRRAESS
jgi:hypothetical protein